MTTVIVVLATIGAALGVVLIAPTRFWLVRHEERGRREFLRIYTKATR